ncbi:MAG TPA: HyaD/HybD family hydrogenase maturation endopeptidase [Gemmatimonadales bacterium]|nr:HyaD/HybD family hydrogenase maturation endopeptidase [Gemmatimonadales bacterium]
MNEPRAARTLVIGLGNPLMGDDGFGLAVLARLRRDWVLPPEVELVDGGTWGMRLLPLIEEASQVLLLDAVDRGAPPGTPFLLEADELPRGLALKLSPHQIDLREVLALAALRETLPAELAAAGAQPAEIGMTTRLSDTLAARVDEVARLAVRRLGRWGHACRPAEAAAVA